MALSLAPPLVHLKAVRARGLVMDAPAIMAGADTIGILTAFIMKIPIMETHIGTMEAFAATAGDAVVAGIKACAAIHKSSATWQKPKAAFSAH